MALMVAGTSLMDLWSNDGTLLTLIEDNAENLAAFIECCCGACCACAHLDRDEVPGTNDILDIVVAGAISGTGEMPRTLGDIPWCSQFTGSIVDLDSGDCDSSFEGATYDLICKRGEPLSEIKLQVTLSAFAGLCNLGLPDPLSKLYTPDSVSCSAPCNFTATWTIPIFGLCGCAGQSFTVTITKRCPP